MTNENIAVVTVTDATNSSPNGTITTNKKKIRIIIIIEFIPVQPNISKCSTGPHCYSIQPFTIHSQRIHCLFLGSRAVNIVLPNKTKMNR